MELPLALLVDIWLVLGSLGLYQLYLQLSTEKRKSYREGLVRVLQRLVGLPALGTLIVFLVDPDGIGFAFFSLPLSVRLVGLITFNLAALVIFWAHLSLREFWSGELETLPEHRLIDTGPYRWVRHPLYSGYLFLAAGFLATTGDWLVGGLMILYFLTVAARTRREEEMLLERLGDTYAAYRERTGKFLPTSLSRHRT